METTIGASSHIMWLVGHLSFWLDNPLNHHRLVGQLKVSTLGLSVYRVPRIFVIHPDTVFEDMRRFLNGTSRGK